MLTCDFNYIVTQVIYMVAYFCLREINYINMQRNMRNNYIERQHNLKRMLT